MPLLDLGSPGVDFAASTHTGERLPSLERLARGSWTLFFAFPRAFTPICSTEIKELLQLRAELERRNVRVVGLSTDTPEEHADWLRDVERVAGAGHKVWFPVVSDVDGSVARQWGMLQLAGRGPLHERTEVRDATGRPTCTRAVYVLNPDFEVAFVQVNPLNAGRNFAETLRVVDALQVTWAQDVVGTPASWRPGDRVVVLPRWPSATPNDVVVAAVPSPVPSPGLADDRSSSGDEADTEPLVSAAQAAKAARAAASAAVAAAATSLSMSMAGAGLMASSASGAGGEARPTSGAGAADVESVTPYLSFASIKPLFGRGMSSLSRAASDVGAVAADSPKPGARGGEGNAPAKRVKEDDATVATPSS